MTKLKLLELFGGIGACSKALDKLGIDYEIVDYVEIDKYACASYNAIHNTNFEPQDICEWNKDIEVDLIMHGSPCFLKGELVNTKDGFKKIEDIEIGEYVKSHDGTYNKVIQTMINKNNYIFDINCSASHNINTTFNHPFYVLRNNQPQYVEVKDLTKDDYMMIPINKNEKEIEWSGVKYSNRLENINKLPFDKKEFWYLIGRFIGDGWIVRRKDRKNDISGIKICCGKHELNDFQNKINDVLPYTLVEERTVYKLQFSNKELGVFCEQFGKGAKNKQIPQNILDLKKKYLYPLLDGIVDSDGCFTEKRYKVTSISKKLIYNIGELVLKLYKIPYHIYGINRPKKYMIENRIVVQNKTYQITWGGNINKNINYVDEDYLYSRIRNIKSRKELCDVYNIEVENTHTYCVYNIATHNCQDFSLAGKQAGGDEGSGTRSSLMYETIRIVKKLRPKYVIWENVKNLLSVKHKHNFDAYLKIMEDLGYINYYQVLNAKDYGIPQNRERVFTISIYDDIDYNTDFEFPKPQELRLKLKDMLDDNVDKKYYLSDAQINRIKTSSYISSQRRIQEKDYCDTLCARDWKDPKCVQVNRLYGIFDDEKSKHQAGSVYDKNGLAPTLDTMQGGWRQPCVDNSSSAEISIRKLTPKECWRLMGFDDSDFEKAAFKKETSYLEGGPKCNATLKIVNEKQRHLDMETYVLCTINDMLDMEAPIRTKRKKSIENENNEKMQNVNIAIEMLGEVEQKECVTNIIKCGENTTVLYTLMEELDQHHMAIIELGKRGKASIEKYMKITLEENLNPMNLYTISTLIEQIIKSKIYTCIVQKANIQGNIAIIEDCVKNLKMMKLLNLKMEYITRLNSDTMLYKQAGNSIVVNVLEEILKNLLF